MHYPQLFYDILYELKNRAIQFYKREIKHTSNLVFLGHISSKCETVTKQVFFYFKSVVSNLSIDILKGKQNGQDKRTHLWQEHFHHCILYE